MVPPGGSLTGTNCYCVATPLRSRSSGGLYTVDCPNVITCIASRERRCPFQINTKTPRAYIFCCISTLHRSVTRRDRATNASDNSVEPCLVYVTTVISLSRYPRLERSTYQSRIPPRSGFETTCDSPPNPVSSRHVTPPRRSWIR